MKNYTKSDHKSDYIRDYFDRVLKSGYGKFLRIAAAVLAAAVCVISFPAEVPAVEPEQVQASQALLGDLDSGRILYAQNADEQVVPASTTKVLTAMLVIEAIERGEVGADEEVTAKQDIIDGVVYDASRVMPYIEDGESLTVTEYLYCILLSSDCVACDILAERVSGSVENFVKLMNDRAAELGCTNTCFVNSHGYPTEGHYTNAVSLFRIMRQAMQYELFREIIATIKTEIPETNKNPARKLYNSNWMIWNPEKITSMYTVYYYPYSIGGKTGSSNISGHCLVSCARKDGISLIAVVTGANNEVAEETGQWTNRSFSESQKLFEWGFENFSMRTVVTSGSDAGRYPVSGGDAEDVRLVTSGSISVLATDDMREDDTERRNVYYSAAVDAPVSSGDVIGRMEIYYGGVLCGSVDLLAAEDVRYVPPKAPVKKTKSKLPVFILVTLVLFMGAVALYITNNKKILIQDLYNKSKNGSPAAGKAAILTGSARNGSASGTAGRMKAAGQRPAQRPAQGQTGQRSAQRTAQGQPGQRPAQRPAQGQTGQRPAQRPAQGQTGQRPAQRPAQGQTGQRPAQRPAQGQTGQRPAQRTAQGQTGQRPASYDKRVEQNRDRDSTRWG